MSKVKIGDKEFEMHHLKFAVAKKLAIEQKKAKRETFDYNSHILATAINACNPDAKLTGDKFDELVDIVEFERVQKEIMEFSGLNNFFQIGGWQEILKVLGSMYNYGYKEVMPLPLDEINSLVEHVKEEYRLKIFLPKAILAYMGVKD